MIELEGMLGGQTPSPRLKAGSNASLSLLTDVSLVRPEMNMALTLKEIYFSAGT